MLRRLTVYVSALLLALAGTALVFSSASKRVAAEPKGEVRAVLVATQLIPAGMTGRQAVEKDLVSLREIPVDLAPTGALTDITPVQDHETATDLQPGEVLLPARFLATALAGTIDIPDDKVAVSLEVADPQRVAGFVRPGSEVAVFATYAVTEPATPPGVSAPVVKEATQLLLPRATVVAIGPTAYRVHGKSDDVASEPADGEPTKAKISALVTLAVSIDDAQKIAHITLTGRVTLGLLEADSRTAAGPATHNRSLFG